MSKYPSHIDDNSSLPLSTDNVTAVKAEVVNKLRSAILAIESELGVEPSGIYGSVRARLDAIQAIINSLTGAVNSPTGPVGGDLAGSLPNPAVVDLTISGQTQGSIIYFNGTNWIQLAPSTSGYVLTTHGAGTNPTWDPTASLTASAPADVTKSAAVVGVSTSAARADHKHNISTAVPSSIGNSNTEGSATSLARSDHIHALAGTVGGDLSGTLPNPQVNKLTISGQTQGSILYYNGTSWVQLSPGADGYVLTTHSTGQNPTWTAIANIVATNYLTISDWYVNASTGSDTNDGLTSGTSLKTIEELSNRLCPNGDVAFLKQTTTIHVAAGTYGSPYFNIGSGSLIIDCIPTLSSNLTLNAVTNTVASTSTRGEIEAASGTFIDYSRIRVTGGSQIGTLAFSTGLNLSVNKTFVSAFLNSAGSQANLNIGDTVANETLNVTFDRAVFISTNSNSTITVNSAILSDCNCTPSTKLNNCNIINATVVGGAIITFCSISNSNIGYGSYTGYGNQFLGTSTSNFAEFKFSSTNLFDDCNNFFGQNVDLSFVNIQLINRINSIGLIFNINSKVNVTGYLWSGTGSYSTAVIQMKSGSYFSFTNLPSISGTTNIIIAGVNFNWSQLPQSVGDTTAEFNTTYTSAANDLAYWTGSYWKRLPAGRDGYVLTTHSTSGAPTWENISFTNSAVSKQAAWYVNGTTGNDDNDGKTSGTALRTSEALCQRLCPNGSRYVPQQATTIYFAAGPGSTPIQYGELFLRCSTAYLIKIVCEYASGPTITLSAVVDTVPEVTRGQITTVGATSFNNGKRYRATSGANSNAITYSTGQNASTKNHFIKEWYLGYDTSLPAVVTISPGTTCVEETLLISFSRIDIEADSLDNTQNGWFELRNAKISNPVNAQTHTRTGTLNFVECEYTGIGGLLGGESGDFFGSASFWNCAFFGVIYFSEQFPTFNGCIIQSGTSISSFPGTQLAIYSGNCFNNAHLYSVESGSIIWINGNVEFCNGGVGSAIELRLGSTIAIASGKCWGLSTSYDVGVKLGSLCKISTPNNTTVSIPATTQVSLTGHNHFYANMPKSYPDADCVWAIDPDTSAVEFTSSSKASFQANWYVNASTGNDGYDGKTSLTPFATVEKLNQTLCPNGSQLIIRQNTIVHIAAGSYNQIELNVSAPTDSGYTFEIACDFTSSTPFNLSAVTDTVPSTTPVRGNIQCATGVFTDKARIRATSGINAGAVTYCTGLNGGATNAWVKQWFLESTLSTVNIANGTTCVIDTLGVTLSRARIKVNNIAGNLKISNAILPRGIEIISTLTGSASVIVSQCYIGNNIGNQCKVAGNIQLRNCQLIGFNNSAPTFSFWAPANPILWGCEIETVITPTTSIALNAGNCFNSGNIIMGGDSSVSPDIVSTILIGTTEWVNGSTITAVKIYPGCHFYITGQQFGFGSPYSVGFNLFSGAKVFTTSSSYLGILATQQIIMSGINVNYMEIPRSYPEADCVFSLMNDTSSQPFTSNNKFSSQANWYVNDSTGNDGYDGKTSLTPFKTIKKLSQTLCPSGQMLTVNQNTNVNIAAGTYTDELSLNINSNSFIFNINGSVTSGSNITLSSVTNTVPGSVTIGSGTRGQIATASGTFVVGQMLRCVSGSNPGAIAFVQELNGDAQHAFVTHWHTKGTIRGNQVNLTAGDVVVVDTNVTSLSVIYIEKHGAGLLRVNNITNASSITYTIVGENTIDVIFDACTTSFGNNVNNCAAFTRCQGGWFSSGGYLQFLGGNHFNNNYLNSHTKIDFSGGDCISGAGLAFYDCQVAYGLDWAGGASTYGMQFENMSTALLIGDKSQFSQGFSLPLWGVKGSTSVGINVQPNATFNYTAIPTIKAVTPMVGGGIKNFSTYTTFSMPAYNSHSITNVSSSAKIINDGYISLLGTNVNFTSETADYKNMVGGIYIGENTVNPSANPSNGSFLYVDHFNHHPTIRTQDGYIVDLTSVTKIDNSAAASVANWYVNASTGNDNNNGFTALTALKTSEELSRRLCPSGIGISFKQDTYIYFAAGNYGKLTLNIIWDDITPFSRGLTIYGDITQVITGNVLSVTNTVSKATRGQITVASGTLVAKSRIQSPPTAIANFSGAITFSNGLNANAQNSFIPVWSDAFTTHDTTITTGAPVSVDTLNTTINDIDIQCIGNGYLDLTNLKISRCSRAESSFDISNIDYLLQIVGCEISGSWYNVHADFLWTRTINNISFIGGSPRFFGCSIQNKITFLNQCYAQFRSAVSIDGGQIELLNSSQLLHVDSLEFENGGSGKIAIKIGTGCFLSHQNYCWGITGNYDVGVQIASGAGATFTNPVFINLPSVINVILTGHNLTFANLPASYLNAGCYYSLDTDSSSNILIDGYYSFLSTNPAPQIIHLSDVTSINTTGKTFNVTAQSMQGTNTRGGNLVLSSGTGTSLLGAPDGYIQINRGTQIVANWLTGNNNAGIIDDFIALGKIPALTGNIRLSNSASIKFRKADNSGDIVGLSVDSSNNIVTTANVSNSASSGAGTALPGNPEEYLIIVVNGNIRKIPLYLT